jgi:Protein of unknown function (DUF429)
VREVQTIYGIDFSGAKDAGNKIWIAKGVVSDGGELDIEECLRARDLPNSGTDIKASLAAIVNLVKSNPNAVFGFDFPFGLPISLVREKSWIEWVLAFPKKYESPEGFRKSCREACKNRELRRQTDTESHTPFSSYNLRLYKQSYFGISSILSPLVLGNHARILPMQERAGGKPVVLEICPASALKASGLYGPYKGESEVHRAARQTILDRLLSSRPLRIRNERVREEAIKNAGGDALDSIIAATAAFRALKDNLVPREGDRNLYAIEGYVFG